MVIGGYGEGIVLELFDDRKQLLDMTPEVTVFEWCRAVHFSLREFCRYGPLSLPGHPRAN